VRPIRHFLSHQHADRPQLLLLERDLRRRGLASWRDRKDQHRGVATDPAVKAAVERGTDGFVIYGSPNILASTYVWQTEWPEAYLRNRAEADAGNAMPYPVIPLVVRGATVKDLQAAAQAQHKPIPTKFNGERFDEADPAERVRVANLLLRTAIRRRTLDHADPLRLHVTTFEPEDDLDADILVDWSPEFASGADPYWPDLIAARDDLKIEIARTKRPIEVSVNARLGPAFALGRAFPPPARIEVTTVEGWRRGDRDDHRLVTVTDDPIPGGDPRVAVLEASFRRTVTAAAAAAISAHRLEPSRRVCLSFGPDATIVDAGVAAAATASFGDALRRLADDGIRTVHLFYAGPAALALLLGASINAGPSVVLYHLVDGEYALSVRLDG
jgi:hypothetical protein